MLKRHLIFLILISLILLLPPVSAQTPPPLAVPLTPVVHSHYSVLIDAVTGKVLWQRNDETPRAIASTTKILTATLLLERGHLDDIVTAPNGVQYLPDSSLHLKPGEKISLRDLLYAMLLRSANDTAVTGAVYLSGSVPEFAKEMNAKAREIGATHSHFVTPNGLPAPGHYSTAADLALIAAYAVNNLPQFNQIVRTPVYKVHRSIDQRDVWVKNTATTFLKKFPGADGIKTGYIHQAGHCFVGSATRGGWRLIAVALDSNDCREDVESLLDYGFAEFTRTPVLHLGDPVGTIDIPSAAQPVKVNCSDPVFIVVSKRHPVPRYQIKLVPLPLLPQAPISAGTRLGTVSILVDGKVQATAAALAADNIAVRPAIVMIQTTKLVGLTLLKAAGAFAVLAALVFGEYSDMEERLQKVLASAGIGSRRACEAWIAQGRVRVNGQIVTELGTKVDPETDKVMFDSRLVRPPLKRYYLAMNKPKGIISSRSDPHGHAGQMVTDLVDIGGKPMLRPVGRLDADSEGLIFLTDDGDFLFKLTHPRYHVPKTYRVAVSGVPSEDALGRLRRGIMLDDGMTRPAENVRLLRGKQNLDGTGQGEVELTIYEGRNRQVRRMMAALGHTVTRLVRVRIGSVRLTGLPPGAWRHLTPGEIAALTQEIQTSETKTIPIKSHTEENSKWPAPQPSTPLKASSSPSSLRTTRPSPRQTSLSLPKKASTTD